MNGSSTSTPMDSKQDDLNYTRAKTQSDALLHESKEGKRSRKNSSRRERESNCSLLETPPDNNASRKGSREPSKLGQVTAQSEEV